MRLALIRQRYTPYGGAERFLEAALEALLERNVAITLYTRKWPQTRLALIEPHIVDPFHVGRLWRDWSFARRVCREIGRAKLDLVQSHERLTCCDVFRAGDGVHAVWLEERAKVVGWPLRLAARLSPYHLYVKAMERRMFASPWLRAVICNSRMVREEIHQRFGIPYERLPVVYNAVDSEAFHPRLREGRTAVLHELGIAEGATVFLLVGSGYQRKGVATAVEAMRELPASAHLVVVGREKHLARYRALATALGVEGRVAFVGPQSDTKRWYGAADAFVLPTVYDPFPNAALEAMACALPIVTSTKSGAAELAIEHDAGLVCDAGDARALAAHLRALLDPATRARMGANARSAVLPLTSDAMTLSLVRLYKELLEQSAAQQKLAAAKRAAARAGADAAGRASGAPGTAIRPGPHDDAPPPAQPPPAANGAGGTADPSAPPRATNGSEDANPRGIPPPAR